MPLYSIVKLAVFQKGMDASLRGESKYLAANHFADALRIPRRAGKSGNEDMRYFIYVSSNTTHALINKSKSIKDEIQLPRLFEH